MNGVAKSQVGCTPGTRDANNDGKTVEDFLRLANTFVAERRAAGIGKSLPESHAFLTKKKGTERVGPQDLDFLNPNKTYDFEKVDFFLLTQSADPKPS